MNTVTIQMQIPEKLQMYIAENDSKEQIKQYAMILYPYVQNRTISYGKAAEILEIPKLDLIDLYADMGFPYFDMTMQELDQDMAVFRSLRGIKV